MIVWSKEKQSLFYEDFITDQTGEEFEIEVLMFYLFVYARQKKKKTIRVDKLNITF